MNWTEYREAVVNSVGEEALLWRIEDLDLQAAILAAESAANQIFQYGVSDISPKSLAAAYLDALTDFPQKKPRELGRIAYKYACKYGV
jgi:hypothetical protein